MQDISRENKLRLLMVYAAINPDKTRSDKGAKLMQVTLLFYHEICSVIFKIKLYQLEWCLVTEQAPQDSCMPDC